MLTSAYMFSTDNAAVMPDADWLGVEKLFGCSYHTRLPENSPLNGNWPSVEGAGILIRKERSSLTHFLCVNSPNKKKTLFLFILNKANTQADLTGQHVFLPFYSYVADPATFLA